MTYLKNVDLEKEDHSFLAEELLIPLLNKTDLTRVNMFTNHIVQTVVPNKGERPLVFTGFENQVGQYASSFRSFDRRMWLVAVVPRNANNSTYVFREAGGNEKVHIMERRSHDRTTESYGYRLINDVLDSLAVGQEIEAGTVLVRSPSHDEDMNLRYGVNLDTVFGSFKGLNYEDGIILSESAAAKLSYETVEEIMVTVNNNDILVNCYGDNGKYKSFPDVGEETADGVLCARRRISYESALVDLSNRSLRVINFAADTVFYGRGRVVDVSIYSNMPLEEVAIHQYNTQLAKYLTDEQDYRRRLVDVLGPYVEDKECGIHYTPEVSYVYGRAKALLDPETRWSYDKSEYDGLVVRFLVANTDRVVVGSKITNRLN